MLPSAYYYVTTVYGPLKSKGCYKDRRGMLELLHRFARFHIKKGTTALTTEVVMMMKTNRNSSDCVCDIKEMDI